MNKLLIIYLIEINSLSLILFKIDKYKAIKKNIAYLKKYYY